MIILSTAKAIPMFAAFIPNLFIERTIHSHKVLKSGVLSAEGPVLKKTS